MGESEEEWESAAGSAPSAIEPPLAGPGLRHMQDRIADRMFGRSKGARTFGRYVILEPLGEGGLGSVYTAYDPELDRKVAIKIVRLGAAAPEQHRKRLIREAQALAKLSHPNVVQVFDVGVVDDEVFVTMELVRGQTLREWLHHSAHDYWFRNADARDAGGRRPLVRRTKVVPLDAPRPWSEILAVYLQAGKGLAAAHAAGLVHRDFKPDNVMIDREGRARVLDFGLARSLRGAAPRDESSSPGERDVSALDASLTRTGTVMGTPAYMAPEQHRGKAVDARSDQFGFCVALYESLYGTRPFQGATRHEIALAMRAGTLQRPTANTEVPAGVLTVLVQGLAPDPRDRFASMDDLLAALERFSIAPPRASRAVRLAVVAALLLAALAWPMSALLTRPPAPAQTHAKDDACDDARLDRGSSELTKDLEPSLAAAVGTRLDVMRDVRDTVCASSPELRRHRDACVRQRARELEVLVRMSSAAGRPRAERALAELPDPRTCVDRSERGGELEDAEAAADDVVRWALARAEGDTEAAADLSRDAMDRARRSGHRVARIDAALRLARTLRGTEGRSSETREVLIEAAAMAEDAQRPDLAALAWLELARQAGGAEAREGYLRIARTATDRAGQPRHLLDALTEMGFPKVPAR